MIRDDRRPEKETEQNGKIYGIAIADSCSQIIVSTEVTVSSSESGSFPKILDSLEENMKTVTTEEDILLHPYLVE
jgi:hypothetical protein